MSRLTPTRPTTTIGTHLIIFFSPHTSFKSYFDHTPLKSPIQCTSSPSMNKERGSQVQRIYTFNRGTVKQRKNNLNCYKNTDEVGQGRKGCTSISCLKNHTLNAFGLITMDPEAIYACYGRAPMVGGEV